MIDRATAKKFIAEFKGLPFSAQLDTDAWTVLIDCLAEKAENADHARLIVDACQNLRDRAGGARMPNVVDLRDAAYQHRQTEIRPDRECEACGGSGYRVTVTRNGYTGSARCGCWKRQRVEDQPVYRGPATSDRLDLDALSEKTAMRLRQSAAS